MKKLFLLAFTLLMAVTGAKAQTTAAAPYVGKGKFSVGLDDKVFLAKSNLCYTPSTNTMAFCPYGWSRIYDRNADISPTCAHPIDLFYWGATGFAGSPMPYEKDVDKFQCGHGLYSGHSFHDGYTFAYSQGGTAQTLATDNFDLAWQYSVAGTPTGTFSTLTEDQWHYLLYYRANANDLRGMATVAEVPGMILLPDTWITPFGMEFIPQGSGTQQPYNENVYTMTEWEDLESQGAIFLPAAGYRYMYTNTQGETNLIVNPKDDMGRYWTATAADADNTRKAKDVFFYGYNRGSAYDNLIIGEADRDMGYAIRVYDSQIVNRTAATLVDKGEVNLQLNANGQVTWEGHTYTAPGTYYYTKLNADGYKDWRYTVNVTSYVPYRTLHVEYVYYGDLNDNGSTTWTSSRIAPYVHYTRSVTKNKVPQGTTISFTNFTSEYFRAMSCYLLPQSSGSSQTYISFANTGTSDFSVTMNDDYYVQIYVYPIIIYPTATSTSDNLGNVATSCTNNNTPHIAAAAPEHATTYPEDTWRMTYYATPNNNVDFLGWVSKALLDIYDGDEQAALDAQNYVKAVAEETGYTDVPEYIFLKKFENQTFSIKPSEIEDFAQIYGSNVDGSHRYFTMHAVFAEKKYTVNVNGDKGDVYDTNGKTAGCASTSMFSCREIFYEVTSGTELSLNVRNIDDGYAFDYWEVDGQRAGKTLPLVIEVEDDMNIVAHYRSASANPNAEGFVIVAQRKSSENWFYMTANVGTASTKRYQAVDANTNDISEVNITGLADEYYWQIEDNHLKSGDQYSTWTSGNSADLGETGKDLTITQTNDYYTITFTDGSDTRYLSLNSQATNNFFAYYKGTNQKYQLHLIPVGGTGTGIESIQPSAISSQKVLRDGQIYIIRDGKTYTIMGAEVR